MPNNSKNRVKKLVLTDKAREMQSCTYHALGEMEQEFRELFTEIEFREFLDYMNRIDKKVIQLYQDRRTESKE